MELNCTTEKSEKETVKPSWRRRALKIILWLVGVPIALAVLLTIYFCIGGIEWGDWTIPDEATSDLRDWNGAAKLTPEVEVLGTDANGKMTFAVTPGDGTAASAFLRLRK